MNRTSERLRPYHGRESGAQRLTIEMGARGISQPFRWTHPLAERVWDFMRIRVIISADSDAAVQRVKNTNVRNSKRSLLLREYLLEAVDNNDLVAPQPRSFDLGTLGQEARDCVKGALYYSSTVKGKNVEITNTTYLNDEGKLVISKSRGISAQGRDSSLNLPRRASLILSIYGYSHFKTPSPQVFVPLLKSPAKRESAVGVLIATPYTQTLLLRTKETPSTEVIELVNPPSVRLPAGMTEKEKAYFQTGYEELKDNLALLSIASRYNLAMYKCSIQDNIAQAESL